MIIELNVLQDGSCARIFVCAEADELSWQGLREIKIWHNAGKESIERDFIRRQTYDNDFTVRFHSWRSFYSFCEAFSESEYNQGDKFHVFSHNCANAANFALHLAGINLDIRAIKLTSLNPHPILRVPTPFLAPVDLYHKAVAYKIEKQTGADERTIKRGRFFSTSEFKLSLAKQTFQFWGKKMGGEKVQLSTLRLSDALDKHIKNQPHRLDEYLDLTKACVTEFFDCHARRPISSTEYDYDIEQFKARRLSYLTMLEDLYHYFLVFMLSYSLLFGLDSVDDMFFQDRVMRQILHYSFGLLLLGLAITADQKYGHSRTKETTLSLAIAELMDSFGEQYAEDTAGENALPAFSCSH